MSTLIKPWYRQGRSLQMRVFSTMEWPPMWAGRAVSQLFETVGGHQGYNNGPQGEMISMHVVWGVISHSSKFQVEIPSGLRENHAQTLTFLAETDKLLTQNGELTCEKMQPAT